MPNNLATFCSIEISQVEICFNWNSPISPNIIMLKELSSIIFNLKFASYRFYEGGVEVNGLGTFKNKDYSTTAKISFTSISNAQFKVIKSNLMLIFLNNFINICIALEKFMHIQIRRFLRRVSLSSLKSYFLKVNYALRNFKTVWTKLISNALLKIIFLKTFKKLKFLQLKLFIGNTVRNSILPVQLQPVKIN